MADAVHAWTRKHHFLLHRLHSLTGIVPVGVFLVEHLFTNSMAFLGPEKYNEHVHWIHGLPYLLLLELFGIFLPLAFHAGYGVVIAREARHNVQQYPYLDNWRFTLQRITGWIAFVYILLHLGQFRFGHWFGLPAFIGHPDPFALTVAGMGPIWAAINFIGLVASVYHLCNGIVTFCIRWGITVGDLARKRVGYAALALGVVLMAWGMSSIWAFRRPPPSPSAPPTHAAMPVQQAGH